MTWPEQDPAWDATTAPGQEPFHLGAFGSAARSAGEPAGTKLAQGEAKAALEAASLGTRPRVAAEMIGLLGAESGEAVLKVQGLGHAFKEVQEAYGGFGRALAATAQGFVLVAGFDFLKESVSDAMAASGA